MLTCSGGTTWRISIPFYLPETFRRGPCPYIPYEDLATSEFDHTAELGKELYGAGEVFWSTLLFDSLGRVDQPDVLCLSLDVPCLDLSSVPFPPPEKRRFLLYNPDPEPRDTTLTSQRLTKRLIVGASEAIVVGFAEG